MTAVKRELVEELMKKILRDLGSAKKEVELRAERWAERLAFYRGLHYSFRRDSFAYDLEDPTGEAMEIHNYIPAFVKAAVAARIRYFPNPQVPAADGDQTSMARARATERLLKSFIDDSVLNGDEFTRSLYFAAICGGSWLKVYWDPFAGKPVLDKPSVELVLRKGEIEGEEYYEEVPELDEFGEEVLTRTFEGEIKVAFVDLFDGWPDPSATKASEMRFWIHRKIKPIEDLEEKFPEDVFGKAISWPDVVQDRITNSKFPLLSDDPNVSGTSKLNDADNRLGEIYEYWGAPSPRFPNGILVVFADDSTILHVGACPYRPARLPVVFMPGDNIVPGGFYPEGVVEHLIGIQRTLNRAETKKREWLDKMLTPYILVPNGSDIDPDAFSEIGGVVGYQNGLPPHTMGVPDIPGSMFSLAESLVSRMKEVSTYSDISRGDVPAGVESGRAISFLQENEHNIRASDVKMYKEAVLQALKQCLWLAKQYYEDGRMIRTLGEDSWTLFEFQDADYDWNMDLAPEAFSGAPQSRALRWAETTEAFSAGMFNDEVPGAKTVRKMLDLDHANRSTIDPDAVHIARARSENMQVLQMSKGRYGGPINPVQSFHDHNVHLEEHNVFRNSDDYLDLSPAARSAIDAHCDDHEAALSGQMNLFAANQEMLPQTSSPSAPAPGQPQAESPMDGGAPAGEPQPKIPIPGRGGASDV